jgi:hypothetical protein
VTPACRSTRSAAANRLITPDSCANMHCVQQASGQQHAAIMVMSAPVVSRTHVHCRGAAAACRVRCNAMHMQLARRQRQIRCTSGLRSHRILQTATLFKYSIGAIDSHHRLLLYAGTAAADGQPPYRQLSMPVYSLSTQPAGVDGFHMAVVSAGVCDGAGTDAS